MKKIEVVMSTYKLESLQAGLVELGITDMTVSEVKGYRKGCGKVCQDMGCRFDFVPEIMVMIIVADDQADLAIKKIIENVKTGSAGNSVIILNSVEKTYRIQSGGRREWKNSRDGRRW